MWKFIDIPMIICALGAILYLVLSLRDRTNVKLYKRRELFTGLFFIFWGLGDILNRNSPTFGMAFLGLGVVWLVLFYKGNRYR